MNSRGKKVLDIKWEHEGVEIVVPVKAYTGNDSHSGLSKMYFGAVYEPAGIDEEDPDINKIKTAVEAKLKSWYSVKWDLWMLVEVGGGDRGHNSTDFNVKFEVTFYVIGIDSQGKERHMRIPRPEKIEKWKDVNPTRWGGEQPRSGRPEIQNKGDKRSGHSYDRSDETSALVPATPENVAAVDKFTSAMEKLLDNMHGHFSQPNVMLTLSRVADLLLPAPKA